jgi:hypothetical protein
MQIRHLAAGAALIALSSWSGSASADPMAMDTPVQVNGIETVCTGIGDEAQADPRWKTYPIRIEFSNDAAQYLSGAQVTLKDAGGKALASVDCAGPWVLFQLKPGKYSITATLTAQPGGVPRSASFSPPASGQKRVVLQFKTVQPNQ